jgi:hypothetical protein
LETFRCPTCLFVLADPGQKRCPSCHKRLRRRGQPIVLGDKPNFGSHEPTINLVLAERAERLGSPPEPFVASVAAPIEAQLVDLPDDLPVVDMAPVDIAPVDIAAFVSPPPVMTSSSVLVPPVYTTPPVPPVGAVVNEPVTNEHTTIFEPSQFDPEMRQVLDSLYRKARSAPDDETV